MGYAYRILVAGIVLLAVVLVGSSANAADQGITGKKLLLKTGKLVLLSKEAGISIAGSAPTGGADSSVSFDDGNGPVTFSLPKTNWSTNGSMSLFKYKNASAPGGPSAVKIAKVKPGLLKVVATGLPFAVPNGAATIDVVLSLDGGTNTYCMTFSGTGDGSKFLAKDATAGTCAGGGGEVCGNNLREGSEQCDGTDAASCPGNCQPNCTCPAQICGNGVLESGEQCDPPGYFGFSCLSSLFCGVDCTCEDPCPAALQGCFTGTATGLISSFTATVNDSSGSLSGTITTDLGSFPFTGTYVCPSASILCGDWGEFTIGYSTSIPFEFSFSASACVVGANEQQIILGSYVSTGGSGTLFGGPCP